MNRLISPDINAQRGYYHGNSFERWGLREGVWDYTKAITRASWES